MKHLDIIIAIYNAEKYLDRCLSSLKRQTCQEFRLILVNDGSTDDSLKICEEYKLNNPDTVIITIKNSGVSSARNLGFSSTNAEFICFLDADDYIDEEYVAQFYNNLSSRYDLFIFGYDYVDENSNTLLISNFENSNSSNFYYSLLLKKDGYRTALWNKVFRRSILQKNNISFVNDISIGEDLVYLGNFLSCLPRIKVIKTIGYHYYVNPKGALKSINHDSSKIEKWHSEWVAISLFEKILTNSNKRSKDFCGSIRLKKVIVANKLLKYTKSRYTKVYKRYLLENLFFIIKTNKLKSSNKLGILFRLIF